MNVDLHGDPTSRCLSVGRGGRAGTIRMNSFMLAFPDPPFGGYGQSGLHRELGRGAVEDYAETKTFHMHHGPLTVGWTSGKITVD
jgi:betaine-aldehyde dehydrogenase